MGDESQWISASPPFSQTNVPVWTSYTPGLSSSRSGSSSQVPLAVARGNAYPSLGCPYPASVPSPWLLLPLRLLLLADQADLGISLGGTFLWLVFIFLPLPYLYFLTILTMNTSYSHDFLSSFFPPKLIVTSSRIIFLGFKSNMKLESGGKCGDVTLNIA